jgi:hypothetical protein
VTYIGRAQLVRKALNRQRIVNVPELQDPVPRARAVQWSRAAAAAEKCEDQAALK